MGQSSKLRAQRQLFCVLDTPLLLSSPFSSSQVQLGSSPAFGLCEKFTVWSKLTKRRFFLIGCMTIEPVILHQSSRRKKNVHKFRFNFGRNVVSILTRFKYTLCFYLCTQFLSYLPPFFFVSPTLFLPK